MPSRMLSVSREYLVTRYGPNGLEAEPQINRMTATPAEVTHQAAVVSASIPNQSAIDR